jgi:hypothetical protein
MTVACHYFMFAMILVGWRYDINLCFNIGIICIWMFAVSELITVNAEMAFQNSNETYNNLSKGKSVDDYTLH